MGTVTDEALWSRVRLGDRRAFGSIYERHGGRLLGLARHLLGREAEDLVHDVFLEAWRQARAFDPRRGSLRAWLALRLRSRALDRLKSHAWSRVDGWDPVVLAVLAAPTSELDADRGHVLRALDALPVEQRQAIWLAYFEGLSFSEIAERLAVPLGTVKSRMASALTRLRVGLAVAEAA